MSEGLAGALSWAYGLVVVGVAVLAARRARPRAHEALVWLGLVILASLRSPLAPHVYVSAPAVWLLTLVAWEARVQRVDPELANALLETDPERLTRRSQRWAQMASAHGRLLVSQGRFAEAESQLRAALSVLERDLKPDDPRTQRTRAFLAEFYRAWGRPEKAAGYTETS